MDCEEIQRRAATGGNTGDTAVLDHLRGCSACAAMVAAAAVLGRAPTVASTAPAWAATLAAIERDERPLSRLHSWSTPGRQACGFALALAVPLAVFLLMPRDDLGAYPTARWYAECLGLAVASGWAASLALAPLHRPARVSMAHWAGLLGVLVIVTIASLPAAHAQDAGALAPGGHDFIARARGCFVFGTLCAVPTWFGLRLLARDGDRLGARADVVAAASAAVGVGGVYLHCPITDNGHLWLGHVTVLLLPWLWALLARRSRSVRRG